MAPAAICPSCDFGEIVTDPDSGRLVCSSCGLFLSAADDLVHQDIYDAAATSFASSYRRTVATTFRDDKIAAATAFITSAASRLGLSDLRARDAVALASDATSGEFACQGTAFLSALAAASCLIVARKHSLPLSLSEAASAASAQTTAVARLLNRMLEFLSRSPLKPLNNFALLERFIKDSNKLSECGKTTAVLDHSRLLLRCASKWALTTGRQPLPLIAAIISFAANVHGVDEFSVVEVASNISANRSTSLKRYKELCETLVKVACAVLPWGNDVTVKNLVHHGKLLLQMMEMKMKSQSSDDLLESFGRHQNCFSDDFRGNVDLDSDEMAYFRPSSSTSEKAVDENTKLDASKLKESYRKMLEGIKQLKHPGENINSRGTKQSQQKGKEHESTLFESDFFSWENHWEKGKEMTLEEILDTNVGFDTPPPSFIRGEENRKRKREKIDAARKRIKNYKTKPHSVPDYAKNDCISRRKRVPKSENLDLEDCLIEHLLLQGVSDAEIVLGPYSRLHDLYVFDS